MERKERIKYEWINKRIDERRDRGGVLYFVSVVFICTDVKKCRKNVTTHPKKGERKRGGMKLVTLHRWRLVQR